MLAVSENNPYPPQNLEVFILQIHEQVSQYTQIINCKHILCCSQSFRKHNDSSIQEQPPRCRSPMFLLEARKLLGLHDYKTITSIEKCNDLVQQLIKPLCQQVKSWRDSRLCHNCMMSYSRWDFEFCVQRFDNIIGHPQERNKIGKLRQTMQFFDSSLEFFEQEYSCIENS